MQAHHHHHCHHHLVGSKVHNRSDFHEKWRSPDGAQSDLRLLRSVGRSVGSTGADIFTGKSIPLLRGAEARTNFSERSFRCRGRSWQRAELLGTAKSILTKVENYVTDLQIAGWMFWEL